MPSCAVFGCNNRTNERGITFHKFPKNKELREKWTIAVKRDYDWVPGQCSTICSEHFRKEDFDLTSLCRVRLREEAVPCVFPHPEIPVKDLKERRPLKRKCDDALSLTHDTDHSPRVYTSPGKALDTELKTTQTKLCKSKKKIKYLQQKTRRLLKKVANLESTLRELRGKFNMSEESSALLDESISKTSEFKEQIEN